MNEPSNISPRDNVSSTDLVGRLSAAEAALGSWLAAHAETSASPLPGIHNLLAEVREALQRGEHGAVTDLAGEGRAGCSPAGTAAQAEERLRFLSEATAVLSSSLDCETTLQDLSQLAVPFLGDYCSVYVIEESGPRRVAASCRNAATEARVHELRRRLRTDHESPHPVWRAIDTGRPEVYRIATEATPNGSARGSIYRETLRELGVATVLTLPLIFGRRTLGVMIALSLDANRRYAEADVAQAMELAYHAALALDNARLYLAEQRAHAVMERVAIRMAALQGITAALSRALTPKEVARVVLEQGFAALGACAGSLSTLSEDGQEIEMVDSIGYPQEIRERWHRLPIDAAAMLAEAVRTRQPVLLDSLEAGLSRYPILAEFRPISAGAWAAVPLVLKERTVGVMGLGFAEARSFGEDDRAFMLSLARQCAQALDRARLYEAEQCARIQAEATQRQLGFLADTARVLASSLEYEDIVQSLAQATLPFLADCCGIVMLDTRETARCVALAHVDNREADTAWAATLRRARGPGTRISATSVLRTGQAELYPELCEATLETLVADAERREAARQAGFRSAMIVPLIARGKVMGAMWFARARGGSRYGQDDLALAKAYARGAALAIDNAQLYRAAREAIHARDDFLSIAAHELRTPITSLRGFAQVTLRKFARQGTLDPDWTIQALRTIDYQSRRLALLVAQLLDISRIDSNRMELDRTWTDVVRLAESVVAGARPGTRRHELTMRAAAPVMAMVDALRLERVMVNLVDNAIKYSPAGGTIAVEVSMPEPGQVRISVRDYGVGIPPEHRRHIFDRFYRAHDDSLAPGLGIGLYVSQQIVLRHGGTLEADFPPDGGTRFVVSLPAGETATEADEGEEKP